MAEPLALSRREAKAVTRKRLLNAAMAILDDEGDAGLTTVAITGRAGIAQSSFYGHFADVDELLHALVDDLGAERNRLTRDARRQARTAHDAPSLRQTFRVPLNEMVAHPRLTRLLFASRYDRTSPVGEWSRQIHHHNRRGLIEDLATAGLGMNTPVQGRRAEMFADTIIGMTEALALGYLEGRYTDIEELIDTLVIFSQGYLPLLDETAADHTE
jgi:AcrR family transcriptional regulator